MNYIGIDTSAYTTSMAVVNDQTGLVWENRRLVEVEQGETGLAQSAAFFQHVRNLPGMLQEMPDDLWPELGGVGVSIAPRPVPGSYMPVFTAGMAVAQAIASARQIPLVSVSHQEGHIAAGVASIGGKGTEDDGQALPEQGFLAVHLSGGTTELLLVAGSLSQGYKIEILGGTTDLHAGQFVDRVGVSLGLPFPAGKELEKLARESSPGAVSLLPSSVRDFSVSFSGVETAAHRLFKKGIPPADLARAVEGCVARTIAKLILAGIKKTGLNQVLIVGGVSANLFIRQEIGRRVDRHAELWWAEPDWSRDNAIGVAFLTRGHLEIDPLSL